MVVAARALRDFSMNVTVKLRPDLIVLTRIKVLHGVMQELAEALGADSVILTTITKGVLERRLISAVDINYLNVSGKLIGRASLKINWRDHTLWAESDGGKTFEMDAERSLSQQVSEVYKHLVEHAAKLRTAFSPITITAHFTYCEELWGDAKKLEEARTFLDLRPAPKLEWANKTGPEFTVHYSAEKLREFTIIMQNLK